MPFAFYQVFYIEKPAQLSDATLFSFVQDRVTTVLEFALLYIPILGLVYKVIEYTGDYTIYVFLGLTVVVEFCIIWVYPRAIACLKAKYEPLEDKLLMGQIDRLCAKVGFKSKDRVFVEESYSQDLHANAHVSFDRICFSKNLLEKQTD